MALAWLWSQCQPSQAAPRCAMATLAAIPSLLCSLVITPNRCWSCAHSTSGAQSVSSVTKNLVTTDHPTPHCPYCQTTGHSLQDCPDPHIHCRLAISCIIPMAHCNYGGRCPYGNIHLTDNNDEEGYVGHGSLRRAAGHIANVAKSKEKGNKLSHHDNQTTSLIYL